jgi:ankyrin repeat protein
MMELLLQYGARLDVEDMYRRTPLHYCMLFNTTQTAKLLLRKGANPMRKVSKISAG